MLAKTQHSKNNLLVLSNEVLLCMYSNVHLRQSGNWTVLPPLTLKTIKFVCRMYLIIFNRNKYFILTQHQPCGLSSGVYQYLPAL